MNFSSLDVHLHTETLLNAMNYVNNLLPKQETKVADEPVQEKIEEKKDVLKKLSKFLYSFYLSFLFPHQSKTENRNICYFFYKFTVFLILMVIKMLASKLLLSSQGMVLVLCWKCVAEK